MTQPGQTERGARLYSGIIPVSGIKYVGIERKTIFYCVIPAAFIGGILVYVFAVRGGGLSG